jgi:hypothetical protein
MDNQDPNHSNGTTGSFFSRLLSRHAKKKEENLVIDEIVNHIEPKISGVRGYRDYLRDSVKKCHRHCQTVVASIVGPEPLSPAHYHSHPVIHASFAGRERLDEFLRQNAGQLHDFSSETGELFGLLTMTREEKTIFGRKMVGKMIVGDAPMQAFNFTEHRIVGVADSLAATKSRLEELSLEVLAESARRELQARRSLVEELRDQQSRLKAMARMFGLDRHGKRGTGYLNEDQQEKQAQIQVLMAETEEELSQAKEETVTPNDWLKLTATKLSHPEKILYSSNETLKLDWRNIQAELSDEKPYTIPLTRFTLAGELRRDAVLVNFRLG